MVSVYAHFVQIVWITAARFARRLQRSCWRWKGIERSDVSSDSWSVCFNENLLSKLYWSFIAAAVMPSAHIAVCTHFLQSNPCYASLWVSLVSDSLLLTWRPSFTSGARSSNLNSLRWILSHPIHPLNVQSTVHWINAQQDQGQTRRPRQENKVRICLWIWLVMSSVLVIIDLFVSNSTDPWVGLIRQNSINMLLTVWHHHASSCIQLIQLGPTGSDMLTQSSLQCRQMFISSIMSFWSSKYFKYLQYVCYDLCLCYCWFMMF